MNFLYIDPGTGSMLFSILIGIVAAASFGLRAVFLKLKFLLSGGKAIEKSENIIPYVIFSDHKRYWNIFKPICDEFEKRKIPLVYYTASEDDPALCENYEFVKSEYLGSGNKPYAKLNLLKADILLSTTPGLDVYQWKKSRNVKKYIHIPHTVDDLSTYRMFGLDYYDAVVTSGEHQKNFIQKIEGMRNIEKKEFVCVGSTYMDFMQKRMREYIEKNPESTNANENDFSSKKSLTVLLAPSWGKSGILSKFGSELLEALDTTGFKIIIRPHPQSLVSEQNIIKPLEEKFSSGNFEWNYDNDNFDCLAKADIMITDFSGVIFDFAFIFNRPIIYADTEFDTAPYDASWVEDRVWSLQAVEKIGVKLEKSQFPDIKNVILSSLENKELKNALEELKSIAWENQGEAAKKTVDYMISSREKFTNENL